MNSKKPLYAIQLIAANPPHPLGSKYHNRASELLSVANVPSNCPDVLYRYLPFGLQNSGEDVTGRTLQMVRDGAFWFSPPRHLNDPCEMAFMELNTNLENAGSMRISPLSSDVAKNRDKCRVCCFSSEWNQGPMWAHYAGGQSGICIGFDTKKLVKEFFKVNYEKKDLSEYQGSEGLLLAMTTKTEGWEYEKEWRLIYPWSMFKQSANDGEIDGCHQHLDLPVREIIFGHDVDNRRIKEIADLVSPFKGVDIYRLSVMSEMTRKLWL